MRNTLLSLITVVGLTLCSSVFAYYGDVPGSPQIYLINGTNSYNVVLTNNAGQVAFTNGANLITATFTGDGSALTNIPASGVSGTAVTNAGLLSSLTMVSNTFPRTQLGSSNTTVKPIVNSSTNFYSLEAGNGVTFSMTATSIVATVSTSYDAANSDIARASGTGTNVVLYGDVNATNWTTTTPSGWLNTNTVGGYTRIQNGNVTSSGTNTSGYFIGNGGGLTNIYQTNVAPTTVTIGATAPDFWQKAYTANGGLIGFMPVWTNH